MFRRGRKTRLTVALVALTALGLLASRLLRGALPSVEIRTPTERLEGFSVRTLAGEEIPLDRLRGQVVLLDSWATWCGSCRSEMPRFQTVLERYRDRGFRILALSIDEAPAAVASFIEEHGSTSPAAMVSEEARRRFSATGVPRSYLLDQRGEIRWSVHGVLHEKELWAAVQALLENPPAGE